MSNYAQGQFYQTYFDSYPQFEYNITEYLEDAYNYYIERFKNFTYNNINKNYYSETLKKYTYDTLEYSYDYKNTDYYYYNTNSYGFLDKISDKESNIIYIFTNINHNICIENYGYILFILFILGAYYYFAYSIIRIGKKIKINNSKQVSKNISKVIKQPEV
jgi:hypothetical protein